MVKLQAAEALLEVAWSLTLVRVVLIVTAVVLVVEVLSPLLGLVLRPLAVDVVGALGLGETVDLGASETGQQLLGKAVGDSLACSWDC